MIELNESNKKIYNLNSKLCQKKFKSTDIGNNFSLIELKELTKFLGSLVINRSIYKTQMFVFGYFTLATDNQLVIKQVM